MSKLHIGGTMRVNGWEVLNAVPAPYVDHIGNAIDLSRFADGSFSEVYASHVLEHFDFIGDILTALREWHRILQPGGILYVSVPDMDILSKLYLNKDGLTASERFLVMRMMFGAHSDAFDYHLVGLNEESLGEYLRQSGFVLYQRIDEFCIFNDTSSMRFKGELISLNIVAIKS